MKPFILLTSFFITLPVIRLRIYRNEMNRSQVPAMKHRFITPWHGEPVFVFAKVPKKTERFRQSSSTAAAKKFRTGITDYCRSHDSRDLSCKARKQQSIESHPWKHFPPNRLPTNRTPKVSVRKWKFTTAEMAVHLPILSYTQNLQYEALHHNLPAVPPSVAETVTWHFQLLNHQRRPHSGPSPFRFSWQWRWILVTSRCHCRSGKL